MGAAWVLKSNATSLLLPGFDFSGMKGVIGSDSIAIKLDGDQSEVKDRLNQLRRELEAEFNIPDNEDIIWEEALNACLHANYIERTSDVIYVITNAGYKVVE